MTVLFHASDLAPRRHAANGPLKALADSLASDLEPVLARDLFIPTEKARMTRRGGRCDTDGTLLEFDPFSPRAHRCPRCSAVYEDDAHYRWWIMGYQLWLAERAVHAAVLFALRGDVRHRDFARSVLAGYADLYLTYPNKDNVLGPSRVFFSTYLEAIWLLQLTVALDLLEMISPNAEASLGAAVRDRIIEPSATIISEYDEGLSNRQVWNNAALLAASRTLDGTLDRSVLDGPSGLTAHLTSGLLADGTWYEGENYHLFAHRGLWYGVSIAESAGAQLKTTLVSRFDEAFATPFITALPDFTFPSRRDSQYKVSLRQWRFAELAELGLVRRPTDDRLLGGLATLYDASAPRVVTGRARSTAEAERNTPATSLDRSDLGWRSLLFAMPTLPPLAKSTPRSALLAEQGYAILRREEGALYAALDYGHSGAGHGHPDRLNVVLVEGDRRWLDDVGTGSYVDPSLHWYRSTLAHNAPLVNGRSQLRVHGTLVAYEDRGAAGWVRAFVEDLAPGVRLDRTLVTMSDYLIDELTWAANGEVTVDLPFHVDGELHGAGPWVTADPEGSSGLEDGFSYLSSAEKAPSHSDVRLEARLGGTTADLRLFVSVPHSWWRAVSIGAPGSGLTRFHFVRARGQTGRIVAMWDLHQKISGIAETDTRLEVTLRDGSRHIHSTTGASWRVAIANGAAASTIELAGAADSPRPKLAKPAPTLQSSSIPRLNPREPWLGPREYRLGESEYRRSEQTWREAGSPTATVSIAVEKDDLVIVVDVKKRDLHFAPRTEFNPLDNEHPDTNSDGVQLHMSVPFESDPNVSRGVDWLLVPEADSRRVRVNARASAGAPPPLEASWARTPEGYRVRCALPLSSLNLPGHLAVVPIGVIVNEMSPDRERRRGQLVLGGQPGEFVYLRGDRHPLEQYIGFIIDDA